MITKSKRRHFTRQLIDTRLMNLLTKICTNKLEVEIRYRQMRIEPTYIYAGSRA
jgi:hypothetical protein